MLYKSRLVFVFIASAIFLNAHPARQARKVTIAYPNGGFNWPLFIAKEGGYYQKYGFDTKLVFSSSLTGVAMVVGGEAQFFNYALEPLLMATMNDSSLTLISSVINRGMFAMVARREITSVKSLKGKRIGVGQLGDANHNYSVAVLNLSGLSARDVQWVPLGFDASARIAALTAGRVDAAIVTAPAYFRLEGPEFAVLVDFAQQGEIFASTAILMKKSIAAADRDMAKGIIRAHADAIERFYRDKPFAVSTFMRYEQGATQADVERLYELYARPRAFEAVPYVLASAVGSVINQQSDPQLAARLSSFSFADVIDNRLVRSLAEEGFFERVFGREIRTEVQRKTRLAF